LLAFSDVQIRPKVGFAPTAVIPKSPIMRFSHERAASKLSNDTYFSASTSLVTPTLLDTDLMIADVMHVLSILGSCAEIACRHLGVELRMTTETDVRFWWPLSGVPGQVK
jgi:hypothetical protein